MTSEFHREQELRRMLTEAVEPLQPAPGAQARLLARARAQQRRSQRPLMARWAPAALATMLVILGVTVVLAVRGGHSSNGSSASTAAGAPSGGALPSRAAVASPAHPPSDLSRDKSAASAQSDAGSATFGVNPQLPVPEALQASDLDGDGVRDTFDLAAGRLVAHLSHDGLESVSLPPLGTGATVLGLASLTDPNGHAVLVVFVRLRQVGASATDTLASLVDGHLAVLQQGSGPALLAIDARHGYACNQGTLALSGSSTTLVVDGARLVPSPELRAVAAAPAATSTGCVS